VIAMGSLRRCFIASPTQAASFALAESQHAWEYLSEDAEWLQEVAVQIIDSFFKGSAPSDPVADATHAYMTGFLRPAGLDTLRQAAGAILRMDALACHQRYDSAAPYSQGRAVGYMLDRLVSVLIDQGVLPARVGAQCALCGLSMRQLHAPSPAPAPPPLSVSLGGFKQALSETQLPPSGEPGWVFVRTLFPCGHLLHEHCCVKLQLCAKGEALSCPTCGAAIEAGATNSFYGLPGTYAELKIDTTHAMLHLGPSWAEVVAVPGCDPRAGRGRSTMSSAGSSAGPSGVHSEQARLSGSVCPVAREPRVLAERVVAGRHQQYLVQAAGQGRSQAEWVAAGSIPDTRLIETFWVAYDEHNKSRSSGNVSIGSENHPLPPLQGEEDVQPMQLTAQLDVPREEAPGSTRGEPAAGDDDAESVHSSVPSLLANSADEEDLPSGNDTDDDVPDDLPSGNDADEASETSSGLLSAAATSLMPALGGSSPFGLSTALEARAGRTALLRQHRAGTQTAQSLADEHAQREEARAFYIALQKKIRVQAAGGEAVPFGMATVAEGLETDATGEGSVAGEGARTVLLPGAEEGMPVEDEARFEALASALRCCFEGGHRTPPAP